MKAGKNTSRLYSCQDIVKRLEAHNLGPEKHS